MDNLTVFTDGRYRPIAVMFTAVDDAAEAIEYSENAHAIRAILTMLMCLNGRMLAKLIVARNTDGDELRQRGWIDLGEFVQERDQCIGAIAVDHDSTASRSATAA
jgi:hypothetical protein